MPDTPTAEAIRDQTACLVHVCEDLSVIATSLEHMCETLDHLQEYFTGEVMHKYPLPPQHVHPEGTHPTADD